MHARVRDAYIHADMHTRRYAHILISIYTLTYLAESSPVISTSTLNKKHSTCDTTNTAAHTCHANQHHGTLLLLLLLLLLVLALCFHCQFSFYLCNDYDAS